MNVQQSKFRLSRWAGATLALGLLLSGLGAWGLALVNEQQARMALEREAELLAEAVTRRVELYQYGLRGVRGALLTAGEAHIDRELFRRYSLTRDIDREFPGARGFGFIRRVAAADEAGFLRQARADGQPEFRIQQLTPHDGERYVIQYIEPVARNGQALGLDIASEANRREAARAALETGQVRLTGPITLVQASGLRQQSFLILMPIYRSGITPPPGPQRELEGFGWSYAPLLTGEVLAGLPIDNAAIHLELSDVTGDGAAVPFFVNGAAAPAQRLFGHMLRREIYGRHWQMAFSALPLFVQRLHQPSPRILFLAGSLVSLLLAALVNASALGRLRRRREAATQARLAAIVGNSADGIIGVGLDGVISDWNRGAEALFGYREEQAVGRRVVDLLVPPSKENEELDILARIARKEQVVSFDTVRRHQDGHLLDVAVTVSPILGPDGGVVGASKTVRDISAKKAAEARIRELNTGLEHQIAERTAELRRLNVLLGSVLQAASEVSIITLDRDGIISGFNLGAERMLGYRADEVVGKASPTLLHSERSCSPAARSWARRFPRAGGAGRTGGRRDPRMDLSAQDGSPLSVTLSVTVLRDEAGAINGYLGIAVDVTEWRNAEREMAAARDQLQMAADVARLGIWRWNLADDSLQWNERMCELYGQPLALRDGGLVYEHWRSRLHPEDLERTEASLRAAVEERGNYDVIFRVVLPDGGIRFIQAGAQVERDADGNPLQVTGINIDITSDQQLQARLREAKEQADAASAAKSSFLANAEPRDPHADECRAGHAATGPADRSQRTPARLPGQGQLGGNLVARPAQRHPRLLEDRGRQTGPGNAPLRAGAADAGPGRGALRQPGRQGRRGDLRHRSRAAQRGGRRPPAPAADPHQSGRQRTEVHRPRARPGELAASGARRPPGAPAGAGGGHRHRHQRGTAAAHLRRFHPGRGVHLATLRRHRPRPVHMQTPGRPDGR